MAKVNGKPQQVSMMELPIEKVRETPGFNPRKELGDLTALVASIRKHGIIEPLVVRPTGNGHFGLICGYRRFNATKRAGLKNVPVTVRDVKGIEALAVAVSENSADARTALTPLDEAEVYSRFRREGVSCEEIGRLCGCSGQKVRKTLELLQAPKAVLKKLREGRVSKMAAIAIVALDEQVRKQVMVRLSEIGGEATEAMVKLIANELAGVPEEPGEPKASRKRKATKRAKRTNGRVPVRRGAREINASIEQAVARAARSKGSQASFYAGAVAALIYSQGLVGWRDVTPASAKIKKALKVTAKGGKV